MNANEGCKYSSPATRALLVIAFSLTLIVVSSCTRLPAEHRSNIRYVKPTADKIAINQMRNDLLFALKENDLQLLQSISSQSMHPVIEQWGKEHIAVQCNQHWIDTLDYEEEIGGGSSDDLTQGYWQSLVYLIQSCPKQEQGVKHSAVYELAIEDLTIEKIDGTWKVTQWGAIEERWE